MKCTSCGAEVPQGDRFCTQCGAPVQNNQAQTDNSNNYNNQQQAGAFNNQPNPNPYVHPNDKAPISMGGWIGRLLIPYIPCVGSIVFLIMLLIWTGDQTKDETFKNWAKAQLIISAAFLGISIIVFLILFATGFFASLSLQNRPRYY